MWYRQWHCDSDVPLLPEQRPRSGEVSDEEEWPLCTPHQRRNGLVAEGGKKRSVGRGCYGWRIAVIPLSVATILDVHGLYFLPGVI